VPFDVPVVPVDRFLAYLTDVGRSPNTVKAYAHDLNLGCLHKILLGVRLPWAIASSHRPFRPFISWIAAQHRRCRPAATGATMRWRAARDHFLRRKPFSTTHYGRDHDAS
jgi:hypothetical protein